MTFPKLHSSAAQELAADVTAERRACWKINQEEEIICQKDGYCLEDKDEEAAKTCIGFGETVKPHYPK